MPPLKPKRKPAPKPARKAKKKTTCPDTQVDQSVPAPETVPTPVPVLEVQFNGTCASTVVSHGTNTLGRPVLADPVSPAAILNNLVCREQTDPSGELQPLSPTVISLQETVRAMSMGTDISPFKEHIQRVAANQPEKSDVVRAFLNQLDHEVIADLAIMRANSIRMLSRASCRKDITVSEALVVWRTANEQMQQLKKDMNDNVRAVDTTSVVEKIDFSRQQTEIDVQKKWEGTTPQGRELIRKKLWELKREIVAAQEEANSVIDADTVAESPKDPPKDPVPQPA